MQNNRKKAKKPQNPILDFTAVIRGKESCVCL